MAQPSLDVPFTPDVVLEVRLGQMRAMPGLHIQSGIDKTLCDGAVHVAKLGIEGDEHDYTFHGGIDKAVHGYCLQHYRTWKAEFPEAAERFRPGGFGENLVLARMNERNVCIGDVVSVGQDGLVLEVSLPRQPCFKLNHRFHLKDFAPLTWRHSRTGWYFRVISPGTVKAGDEVRLVERRHPKWTIERVQEYLHRNQDDMVMNEELSNIAQLGSESRNVFKTRVAKQRAREAKARAEEKTPKWRDFAVVERTRQTPNIVSFVLEAVDPITEDDAALDDGSHARIKLGNGLIRVYSVVDGNRNRFQLGIKLEENSRGGSRYMHEAVQVESILQVGAMTTSIPRASAASNHIFLAGGIGLTAFLSRVEHMRAINFSVTLHYAVRSADEIPFRERLEKLGKDVVRVYDKSSGQRMDVSGIIKNMSWNSQLYVCGPKRLMDEAMRAVQDADVPETEVHWEAFHADVSGDPFEVVVANRGDQVLRVGEDESLLDVLKKQFDNVASSCEVGNCGTCKVAVREGRVEHHGTALTLEEKGNSMLSCVSRGIGRLVVEL